MLTTLFVALCCLCSFKYAPFISKLRGTNNERRLGQTIHSVIERIIASGQFEQHGNNKDRIKSNGNFTLPPVCSGPKNPFIQTQRQYDLLQYGTIHFLPDYKNPCWYGDNLKLKCLPYFYLTGMPKCGTTDLYDKLLLHPEVAPVKKYVGYHWLTRDRFRENRTNLEYLVGSRQQFFPEIESIVTSDGNRYHPMILGDGGTSTFWDHSKWTLIPGNERCKEPRITNAHMLHHLFEDTKIIVMFRNPTDRLFSDYVYFTKYGTTNEFHELCKESIDIFKDCKKKFGDRHCIHNTTIVDQLRVRIHIGMYSLYMVDWLKVFPRHQIFDIRTNDYSKEPMKIFKHIFEFLDIAPISTYKLYNISQMKKVNVGKRKVSLGDMLLKTRTLLDRFYLPYNQEMAYLMEDYNYFWQ